MEESVDVTALRARFSAPAPSSSQDSESLKLARRSLLTPFSPIRDTNTPPLNRLSPTTPELARTTSPSAPRQARATPPTAPTHLRATPSSAPGHLRATPSTALGLPRATPFTAPELRSQPGPLRAPTPPVDTNKVRQTGELLQNMMLRHQRPPGPRLSPVPVLFSAPSVPHTPASARPLPRPRSTDDVPPLRRPLPTLAPAPPKPKRPAHVNINQWRSSKGVPPRGLPAPTGPRGSSVSPLPGARLVPVPAPTGPPRLPQRDNKPGRLPRQTTTVDIDDDQETYDDIGSLEKNDSWSDSGSQSKEENEDIYEDINENQNETIQMVPEVKLNQKDVRRQQEQEKKEQQERQRREEQLRKNFQLQFPVEVLHTASVRQDWSGGSKLDLSVRQGDKVDIIRVKNNPEGKWLARLPPSNYGYISNTCVDIDYEAIKRRATQLRRMDRYEGELPPPPPDPPGISQRSHLPDSIDPKIEKELKKKFKFEGPLKVLQTMMVDPNALLKKPGPKHLSVSPGDVLDVLQLHSKKALCRDKFGRCTHHSLSDTLIFSFEGDIYDDVEYPSDVYDNDNVDN
ncbi:hypothetical protein NQD34_002781 [Periophthalmus magnuspinnatus]|nr:hypothetical protein NQD34_002781 [Periophthalmus magnuspinnatus]